jgi:tRNA (mo5U34)-methyltransferase
MSFDFAHRLEELGWSPADFQRKLDELKWFHTFCFPGGIQTRGYDPTITKLEKLSLPASLAGKTVIDVGAYDGFFSFECERRGAARVVANDHWAWNWSGCTARRNVEFLRDFFQSRIEMLDLPVEQLRGEDIGKFDVVLFLGVLYHAPDPVGYLRRIRSITGGMLVLETLVDALDINQPAAAFYEALNNDTTNVWGPNRLAVEAMAGGEPRGPAIRHSTPAECTGDERSYGVPRLPLGLPTLRTNAKCDLHPGSGT